MNPMCHVDTGYILGWATAVVSCDGTSITIEYINTAGVSQGTTKPSTWQPCRPGWSSDSIQYIVQLTQAAYDALGVYDPNTLYLIVE